MSAYKKLNKQDTYITTYTAHKPWAVSGSDFQTLGIQTFIATGSYLRSLQQLYYPVKEDSQITSHAFDYYNQTTLNFPQARNLTTASFVVSIPKTLYGTYINPGAELRGRVTDVQNELYVSSSYWEDNYTNDTFVISLGDEFNLIDDGEGNLYQSGSSPRRYVGDVIYPHGMVIITDVEFNQIFIDTEITNLYFESSHPIYTYNAHCKLKDSEFNFTFNPSALSSSYKEGYYNGGDLYTSSLKSSNGILNNNITGSEFNPYITTVGLYNDANELIAVGKLGQPVPKSKDTDMTFTVKIDL
jgi:hypothetical protein